MPTNEPEDRTRLAERMERERVRGQRGTWDDVAREMGMSSALLRRIRNGTAPISYDSEVKIELFYGWDEGTLRAELPIPDDAAEPTDEEAGKMSYREIAARILELASKNEGVALNWGERAIRAKHRAEAKTHLSQ